MKYRSLRLFALLAGAAFTGCDGDGMGPLQQGPGQVLFTVGLDGEREIWEMSTDGSDRRRLTSNTVADETPRWAESWAEIVFARARPPVAGGGSPRFDIHIMRANGSNARIVAESPSSDRSPTMSPNGSTIAFLSYDATSEANYVRIYAMELDGTNRRIISPLGLVAVSAAEWSLTGSQIIFTARRFGESSPMELFMMNADGTGLKVIPDPCANDIILGRWSRSAFRISLACNDPGESPMYTMTSAGLDVRRITPPKPALNSIGDAGGLWSVMGERLLVVRDEEGTMTPLYSVNVQTGAAIRVAEITDPTFWLADWLTPYPPD